MTITQEQIDEWLAQPVTRAFAAHLRRSRQTMLEFWAAGGFMDDTEFKTAVKEAAAIRHCQVLETLLNVTPEDFEEL
jgi:hypothetical protein